MAYKREYDKKAIEYNKKWYQENKEEVNKRHKIYNAKPENIDKERERVWKSRGIIGMTRKRYDDMLKEQNGNCSICGRNKKEFKVMLGVDHNHDTGEVRGLLCHKCNTAIGGLEDNIDLLLSAVSYLRQENYV